VARRVIEQLVDDIDGGPAEETVSFSYQGVDYDIDLSAKNAAALRNLLTPYADAGRRTTGQRPTSRRLASVKPSAAKTDPKAVREWATKEGKAVSSRGRVPASLVAEFHEAHS
jgi:hypothetical protein